MSREFEDNFAFGQDGEHAVARLAVERGRSTLGLWQFANTPHAPFIAMPHIQAMFKRGAAPDMVTFFKGQCHFAEVKRKRRWVFWDGRRETGCNDRHFQNYLAIRAATGIPVHLMFLHQGQEPTGLFSGEIANLAARKYPEKGGWRLWDGKSQYTGEAIEKEPISLFPIDQLRLIAPLSALRLQFEAPP